jgi:hypothetical protein
MNVPTELMFKRPPTDPDDLALDYVENEVGRFDWMNNWPKHKEQRPIRDRVAAWLERLQAQADPDDIIRRIDDLVTKRPGRWR